MNAVHASNKQAFLATGRRKTSVARVFLRFGKGDITVNKKPLDVYFPIETSRHLVSLPLKVAELDDRFDITVNVNGGGVMAQAVAVQHGISKALLVYNAQLRNLLKPRKLLRRDSRMKERKKYGQKGARARYQYSKR